MHPMFRILSFLVFFPVAGIAQNIVWSAPLADDNQLRYMKIIGSDENDFYLLRSNAPFGDEGGKKNYKSRRFKLACYSQRMAVRWEKSLAAPVPDAKILEIRIVSGRLLVFAFLVTKNHTLQLYLQYLDAAGNYTGVPVQVDELESARVDEESRPNLLVSKDQSLVAVASRLQKEDEGMKFRVAVCDSALSRLYQKEIRPATGENMFAALDIQLSDSGNIFILGTLLAPGKKSKEQSSAGKYALVSSRRNNEESGLHEIFSPQG